MNMGLKKYATIMTNEKLYFQMAIKCNSLSMYKDIYYNKTWNLHSTDPAGLDQQYSVASPRATQFPPFFNNARLVSKTTFNRLEIIQWQARQPISQSMIATIQPTTLRPHTHRLTFSKWSLIFQD